MNKPGVETIEESSPQGGLEHTPGREDGLVISQLSCSLYPHPVFDCLQKGKTRGGAASGRFYH